MEKKINYQARDFESIKSELLRFSDKYYPQLSTSFKDNSVGEWFIDLVSAIGDELNYFIDRTYQQTNINSATSRKALMAFAKNNGVKVPGPKASMCEIELRCVLPVNASNISQPDWTFAPLIKRGTIVGNSDYRFELTENVNFSEQFNDDGFSNRTYAPIRNNNGAITGYNVTKTTLVSGGQSKIYKKVLMKDDVQPFMEVILPDKNVSEVESIIFKESSVYNKDPQLYEFKIEDEQFILPTESVATYRYFEVGALSDQYYFGCEVDYTQGTEGSQYFVTDAYNPHVYEDYTESSDNGSVRTSRYYKGKWKPITQKYTTEYTDKNYVKITFGGSNGIQEIPEDASEYGEYRMSKVVNNDALGVLPKIGWTMYVLYRTGGGLSSNIAPNSINNIITMNLVYPLLENGSTENISKRDKVTRSLTVNNLSIGVGGKDFLSDEELREFIKYRINSQNRAVVLNDYKSQLLAIPPKFGCPFRCNAVEMNNKIVMPMLFVTANGKLSTFLPQAIVDNAKEYLSHYKTINDYIEMRSGKIYNLGFEADIFVDKNYTPSDVISSVIEVIYNYMDINKHDMGKDVFIGDLEKEINQTDGVVSLIELRVYNIYGGAYSIDKCPLPQHKEYNEYGTDVTKAFFNVPTGAKAYQISMNETDGVLYSDYDAQFEILNKNNDICVRCKLA